jgi:phosphate transport system permease protein
MTPDDWRQAMELGQTSATLTAAPRTGQVNQERYRLWFRKVFSGFMTGLLMSLMVISVAILLIIVFDIGANGIGAINLDFFIHVHRPAGASGGGIAQAIVGTVIMLGVASAVSVPLGILVAIYLVEFGGGWFASLVRFVVDLMLQMPSIVVGIFVWSLLVRQVTGFAGIAGAVSLMVIMTPIVIRSVEEILRLVPDLIREAGLALGLAHWRVVISIVIPTVRSGIVTGVILAMARAAGETAPLLLTALGNDYLNTNLSQPMAAIPLQIYNYATQPSADLNQKAWGASLVLILVIAVFSAAARTFSGKMKHD